MTAIIVSDSIQLAAQPVATSSDIYSLGLAVDDLRERFASTDHIFTDADGTVVMEGATTFMPGYNEYFQQLHQRGIGVTVVTGKPAEEALGLMSSLPADSHVQFLCEKGAYTLSRDGSGGTTRQFILSSEASEREVAALRAEFFAQADTLAQQASNGEQRVWFGLGGSGAHRSVLSIDLFATQPPANYLELIGAERDALKLTDETLLQAAEQVIEQFVQARHPGWNVVHMGNANTEICPSAIEKDAAILQTPEFAAARTVQVWGDSMNDRAMFGLRSAHPGKVLAGLVLHREKGKALIPEVDMLAYGMANAAPYLQLLLETHPR